VDEALHKELLMICQKAQHFLIDHFKITCLAIAEEIEFSCSDTVFSSWWNRTSNL